MELEELEPSKLIGPQQDVEAVESWADRNGLTYGTARAWVYAGVLPTVKLGKRRTDNSALLRSWQQSRLRCFGIGSAAATGGLGNLEHSHSSGWRVYAFWVRIGWGSRK